MKKFKELYKNSKIPAVVSILETQIPSITEELILRTGNKLSKNNNVLHVAIVYKNSINECEIVQNFLDKYTDTTLFYQTAEDLKSILSKYDVVQTVCDDSISERFKKVFSIKGLDESLVEIAIDGNKELFKKLTPSGFRDIDVTYLLNEIREGYNIGTITEKIELPKNEIRENFYNGSFPIGTVVETRTGIAEVISRGSNYVVVTDINGNIRREWPANLSESSDKITWVDNKNDLNELFYKGYQTENFKLLSEETLDNFKNIINENKDPYLILNTIKILDKYILNKEESILEKVETNLEKLTEASDADKLKAANIIAKAVGCEYTSKNPSEIVNKALEHCKSKKLTPESWKALGNMLKLATKLGIKWDNKILPSAITEDVSSSDYKVGKDGRKYPAKRIRFKDSIEDKEDDLKEEKAATVTVDKNRKDNISQGILTADDFKNLINKLQPRTSSFKQGESMMQNADDDGHRRRKVAYSVQESWDEEDFNLSDEHIDDMIKHIIDVDDILDVYDDEELNVVDLDTDEIVEGVLEEDVLNEVLSRVERIRSKMRFARTKAKRERRLELALKKRSTSAVINTRARRLAVKTLKKRLAKRPLDKLSTTEKERLERFVEKRKDLVKRIAMKLAPKVRKIENDRLEHKTTKKINESYSINGFGDIKDKNIDRKVEREEIKHPATDKFKKEAAEHKKSGNEKGYRIAKYKFHHSQENLHRDRRLERNPESHTNSRTYAEDYHKRMKEKHAREIDSRPIIRSQDIEKAKKDVVPSTKTSKWKPEPEVHNKNRVNYTGSSSEV